MIKVGQIYKTNTNYRFTVTYIGKGGSPYHLLFNDGEVWHNVSEYAISDMTTLIAEYPTWQEAVNSNEFKGE